MAARLRELYQKKVVPAMTKEFGYTNVMAVPKVEKISINIGLGEATRTPRSWMARSTSWARSPARSR